jgi:repressor LexA
MTDKELSSVFATNLSNLMAEKEIKQIDIVNRLKVAKGTVSGWCSGSSVPRSNVLQSLANLLMVTPAELLTDKTSIPKGFANVPETESRPVLGRIACGQPILAQDNIGDYAEVPAGRGIDFCLVCAGDSMVDAGIHDGDMVYIRQQADVENGEIAAVRIGDEATLKRVYKLPGMLILQAENKKYPPMSYTEGSGECVEIVGKAVGFTHWL